MAFNWPEPSKRDPERQRVIAECSREALLYRTIPITAGGLLGLSLLKSKGLITPTAGMRFHVLCASQFFGLFSYVGEFKRRLNELDSRLVDEAASEDDYVEQPKKISVMKTQVTTHFIEEAVPGQIQFHAGVDDYSLPIPDFFPYSDSSGIEATIQPDFSAVPIRRPTTTYDELREQNRQRYALAQTKQQKFQGLIQPEMAQRKPAQFTTTFEGQQKHFNSAYKDTSFS